MDSCKTPYLTLFNAVTDGMEQLEANNYDLALWTLERAQKSAEALFIQGGR